MVYYTWIFMESCFLHISFDKTDGRIYAVRFAERTLKFREVSFFEEIYY